MVQNLRKISAYLFGLRLCRTVLSIVTVSLSARYFGIGLERDVWILVSAFITTMNLAVWGPINETFRTKFIYIREKEGEYIALRKTASLLSFIIWGTLLVSALVILFPNFLVQIIAPSVQGEESHVFIRMLYLLLPTFLMNQCVSIGIGILNAYESFYIPEIVAFFSGILHILCLLLLAPIIGIDSLIVSLYLSIVLLLVVLIFYIRKNKICIGKLPFFFSWCEVKPFILFSIPFFIPYFVSQCNAILEKSLSNLMGEGVVSTIDYARRFSDVLLNVFLSVLSSVLVPMLSKFYSNQNNEEYFKAFKQYVQVVFFVLMLTIPLLVGAAFPLDTFFFFRGDISMGTVHNMARLTQCYGVAFIGVAFYLFFGLSLLSQNQGKKYAIYGATAQLIMIVFNILLYRFLGVYTFATTLLVSHVLMAVVMYRNLKLINKKEVDKYIFRYLLLLLLLIIVQTIFGNFLKEFHVVLQMFFHGLFIIVMLPIFAFVLGFDLKQYVMILKRKIK